MTVWPKLYSNIIMSSILLSEHAVGNGDVILTFTYNIDLGQLSKLGVS